MSDQPTASPASQSDPSRGAGSESSTCRRIHIVADPGRATDDVEKMRSRVEEDLTAELNCPVEVAVHSELLQVSANDTTPGKQAHIFREGYGNGRAAGSDKADVVLLVTEMPRHDGRALIAVESFPENQVAIFSNPVFGGVGSAKRLRRSFTRVASTLLNPRERHESGGSATRSTEHRRSGATATLRTLIGMVKHNEPWSTLTKMSGALAAAMGTGAFGIFYSSIWKMASFLSPLRMSLITAVAIVIMVAWLIVANKLWDRPRSNSAKSVIALYNGSTLLTLIMLVVGLYVVLFFAILLGGVAVISPEFLAQQLGEPAQLTHYLRIAWLSTSMGVVAGALGAGFDSDADLRRMTNGARNRQREYAAEKDSDDDSSH